MNAIINLTQHAATNSQIEDGLVDLLPEQQSRLRTLLTVSEDALRASDEVLDAYLSGCAGKIVTEFVLPAIADAVRTELVGKDWASAGMLELLNARNGAEVGFMIGGQPDLMEFLESAIRRVGGTPVRALTERVSEDQVQEDGSVRKVAVFRHIRFRECGRGQS